MAVPNGSPAVLSPKLHPKPNHREMDRTIERRLIRTLHLVEKSIPRFRIDQPAESKVEFIDENGGRGGVRRRGKR
jgi:hypothetical protein